MKYEEIVKYAKKKYPQAEAVVSVYTMQMLWVSKKLADIAEYPPEDLVDKSIREVVEIDAKTLTSLITGRDKESHIIKTKSGKRLMGTTAIKTFVFQGEPYFATFNSSFKPLAS